ncbi:adenosylcobalamin-dependent ribonucleoside-diphosphate reductase [Duganella sp. LX20W]|uniref:Vitamin B12-dependent ribonucleotide reductase n=1 Tax=Rugamonas brunnea TaxID=2758569 RepID=A0A7W2EN46_9BURK|nr:adenosylcobalamin-dependent ribonucleoside-diphosphate reductase [Rugamonas brunnea]MBA5635537.1 adenosylcobalamin-dependent ribonucleoside-diphosphate reductase [Rugamonas brunnea]
MNDPHLTEPIAELVWRARYGGGPGGDASVQASWARVAQALSAPEARDRDAWRGRFEQVMTGFRFLPGGRILAGAGHQGATLFNCFASGTLPDALDGIFSALGETVVTLQAGGGVGCDFSTVRPAGARAERTGNTAAGPLAFMRVWDQAASALSQPGGRGAAMLAALRCDHPDIEAFIDAKRAGTLSHFNLSVLVTDAFMRAVDEDEPWPLVFPVSGHAPVAGLPVCERVWPGTEQPQACAVWATVPARALWLRLLQAAFDSGEPGVIFIDHVQRANNLCGHEQIAVCNPCGEVPLPPHGACNLGSLNLTQFVREPFSRHPKLDLAALDEAATIATRMLDNVYEASAWPLKAQSTVAHATRRLGLGITGLADALAMLGVRYGDDHALDLADAIMRTVSHAAYRASIALADERGAFPAYDAASYLGSDFIQTLPPELIDSIWRHGIRNSHLTALAPAGGISVLANNVSGGVEPIFALRQQRTVRRADGSHHTVEAADYAWTLFRRLHGQDAPLPPALVEARDIDPLRQLQMVSRLQAHVDQGISKTLNLAPGASFAQFESLYMDAWRLGLKGSTVYRPEAAIGDAPLRMAEAGCGG